MDMEDQMGWEGRKVEIETEEDTKGDRQTIRNGNYERDVHGDEKGDGDEEVG